MELKYGMPTRVLMGKDCVHYHRAEFFALGKKALIVTGAHSAKANGALDDLLKALTANGQSFVVYDKIRSNPGVGCVYEGAALAKGHKVDFIVAIGGGSPMDAAKVIALLACQDISEADLFVGKYGADVLPVVCIPTTAGTGSEVTQYAILTNDRAETKSGIAGPQLFPRLALLDAKYLKGLSRPNETNTVIDALSHSIEGIVSARANALTDLLALEGIRLVSECLTDLAEGTLSEAQREKLLLASTLGGMVIANTGTTALHAMGYSLTYFKNIDHGRANGLLLAEYLKVVHGSRSDLTQKILGAMKLNSIAGLSFVMEKLLGEIEKITREEMTVFSGKAIASKNIANGIVALTEADILNVFAAVFGGGPTAAKVRDKRHADVGFVTLEEYLPVSHFRLIPPKLRSIPGGLSEIAVELEVSQALAAKLNFPVHWNGKLYGFVHDNDNLKNVFADAMPKEVCHRRIFLNDWGEEVLISFENSENGKEIARFVTVEEVQNLLNECRKVIDY